MERGLAYSEGTIKPLKKITRFFPSSGSVSALLKGLNLNMGGLSGEKKLWLSFAFHKVNPTFKPNKVPFLSLSPSALNFD